MRKDYRRGECVIEPAYDGVMTLGGNPKQRAATASAVASFAVAIICGLAGFAPAALLLMVLGIVCAVGIWATGLSPASDEASEAEAEWSKSIR